MKNKIKFSIHNDSDSQMTLMIEPWGTGFPFEVNQYYDVVLTSTNPEDLDDQLTIAYRDRVMEISIGGGNVSLKLYLNDKEVMSFKI